MITFKEIKVRNNEHFIVFQNENNSVVEIPVSSDMASLFAVYFVRLSPPKVEKEDLH